MNQEIVFNETVNPLNSLKFWFPIVEKLGLRVPKTEIIEVPSNHLLAMLDGVELPNIYKKKILEKARFIGFPLFMRSDMASGKFLWENTCFGSVSPAVDLVKKPNLSLAVDRTLYV